ncbi:hypothetical protein [Saccharopolyspora sp. NPDC002376]
MNPSALEAAYRELIRTAEAITDPLPEDARSQVDRTIAHLVLSDRILIAAAHDVLAGGTAVVDNREAMDPAALDGLIGSTSHQQRVDLVRRNAKDFTALINRIPEHAAVRMSIVDRDGNPVPDQQFTWNELIHLRATQHLPGHAARLAELG